MNILIRTLRVPVYPDEQTMKVLENTFEEYSKAAQTAYDYAYTNKTSNRIKIHHAIYKSFREQSSLNSQLVINAKNKAVDVIKSLKAKRKRRIVNFSHKIPIRYDYRSSTIFHDKRNVALATTGKRVTLQYILRSISDLNASRNVENKYFDDEYILNELAQKATGFLRGAPVIIPIVAS